MVTPLNRFLLAFIFGSSFPYRNTYLIGCYPRQGVCTVYRKEGKKPNKSKIKTKQNLKNVTM